MTRDTARAVILECLAPALTTAGRTGAQLDDQTDLRAEGIIDSLRFVQLLQGLESRLGMTVDLSELAPERLTVLGALVDHIAGSRNGA